jgi:hypothetical protein
MEFVDACISFWRNYHVTLLANLITTVSEFTIIKGGKFVVISMRDGSEFINVFGEVLDNRYNGVMIPWERHGEEVPLKNCRGILNQSSLIYFFIDSS